ncbi:MAG: CDP-glycerol glycerophosphotransferase family protein [bacterium]|nr:CDP-glycerol glycerophosphotransferase family protein [bacterium]
MKTIFVTIFQGVEARNILRTDIYKKLAKTPYVRLVLFVDSEAKKEYYKKEFNGPNIVYQVIENYIAKGLLQKLFGAIKFNLINTATIDIKRKLLFNSDKSFIKFLYRYFFNRIFARRFFRRIVRWLDWYLISEDFFSSYFDKYKPSLVFLAHLFGGVEIAMLREAKHRGVTTVGLINSWDKITARAMVRLLPDWLMVHNDLVKDDAVKYIDIPERQIIAVGVPHFDYYFKEKRTPADQFYEKLGLSRDKKNILYLPVGRTASDDDWDMLEFFDEIISSGRLNFPCQVIVRFPPNDEVVVKKSYKNKFIFQIPGKRFSSKRGMDWDMNFADFRSLADTLYYSDVVVGYPSTMMIDAAIFDKPIINIKFERKIHPMNFVLWAYKVAHYQFILKTGGVRLANNENELVKWLNNYLDDPRLDNEGRRKLVSSQCLSVDGQAGRRVADFLIKRLS